MRQNIQPDPSVKVFEAFMDFSGGLNTEITNENLKDNEFPVALNVDLSGRSSARLRYGRKFILHCDGTAQGSFFYYRENHTYPDIIMAVSGKLYVKEYDKETYDPLPIKHGEEEDFAFQSELSIEAVQYRRDLFIATGTKLVEVTYAETNEWVAKVVEAYKPSVMEAIYIGTNGLADNPDSYIENGTSPTADVEAIGIKPQFRYAAVNTPITMTAYVNIPSGYSGGVDYKWEYKKSSDATWATEKDWTEDYVTHAFTFDSSTRYDIRVNVRKKGTTTPTSQYVLTSFECRPVANRDSVLPVDALSRCRRILLHWDRILLYGDDTHPYQMYISDLQNPRYIPVSNTIHFDVGKQEPITAAVRFQDMIVIFTKTTIQTLVGKSVEDYRRYQIHDGIGCIAGWTAKVVGNNVLFLSHEGVHMLRPNPYRLETMNVARIDGQVKREMPTDEDACSVVTDSMYWLCFPGRKVIYRYYYELNVWAKDESPALDFKQFLIYGEDVYNFTTNGKLLQHDFDVYTDAGELYYMDIETKFLDLSASFNFKKLKRLYILARHYAEHNVDMKIFVQADSAVVLTPDSGHAEVQEDGSVEWIDTTQPNFQFLTGTTFGTWLLGRSPFGEIALSVQKASIRGKCRRVKIRFVSGGGYPCEVFGFGLEFKMKKA